MASNYLWTGANICCHFGEGGGGGGGDPKKKLDILGGDPEKNGNFQVFTNPPSPPLS